MLYSLIDTVYEAGGTIITTTNACPDELEAHLGVPLYRRLTGINDADGNFISVNGWVLPLRKEKNNRTISRPLIIFSNNWGRRRSTGY